MIARPVFIKPSLYSFILEKCKDSDADVASILECPAKFLVTKGILENKDLLVGLTFELHTQEEVLITESAAERIIKKQDLIVRTLYDDCPIQLSFEEFVKEFSRAKELDYVEWYVKEYVAQKAK